MDQLKGREQINCMVMHEGDVTVTSVQLIFTICIYLSRIADKKDLACFAWLLGEKELMKQPLDIANESSC